MVMEREEAGRGEESKISRTYSANERGSEGAYEGQGEEGDVGDGQGMWDREKEISKGLWKEDLAL